MAKRASASSSSGQPSQPKRPRVAPTDQPWNGSKRNLMLWSCSTEEDAQRVCGEEPEHAKSHLTEYCQRVDGRSTRINEVRNLWLQFQTKLSDPLFTRKKLRGDGGARISVALINENTGDVVTSGLESSLKLDVVVLEGDFNKDDEDDWAHEEFENFMVKERQQKGLLLMGDLQETLNGGVGELGELIFTDNSS
ncbi:calmodulin-binding protein 60 C-like [Eucalyptus grandis]|uniref:calmodulin-binding protein 60 C-like n=1 Tax=Eucalyptus grandis TaxID=71139 RepID=UPI00192EB489|nr:calmodulin-binding protein 60 C-like [Eucalyptus grandis]